MNKAFLRGVLAFLVPLLIGAAFYWFDFRPKQIRRDCIKSISQVIANTNAEIRTGVDLDGLRYYYEVCLHRKGLAR